jgi:porphobilinogen synthase
MSAFPATRMRRLRRHDWSRKLVAETTLSAADFIWPIFIVDGHNKREPVASMPGVDRLSVDLVAGAADKAAELGIPVVALFPYTDPALKSGDGREALNANNLVCRAVREIKRNVPQIGVMCDVALDPYTDHGHDGLFDAEGDNIANDATIAVLVRQALLQAEAGCDIIAPSDMMDGRVGAIRTALEEAGFHDTLIMAYAAKYASAFYGPFRDAVGSAKALTGDKRTYQMNPANGDEALREVAFDIA